MSERKIPSQPIGLNDDDLDSAVGAGTVGGSTPGTGDIGPKGPSSTKEPGGSSTSTTQGGGSTVKPLF